MMLNFLPGYKTYLVSGLMVIMGVCAALGVEVGGVAVTDDPLQLILEGLGLGAVRKGIEGYH